MNLTKNSKPWVFEQRRLIIAKGDKEALERHQASIPNITEAVTTQKESIEEKKFSKGESEEEVSV